MADGFYQVVFRRTSKEGCLDVTMNARILVESKHLIISMIQYLVSYGRRRFCYINRERLANGKSRTSNTPFPAQ